MFLAWLFGILSAGTLMILKVSSQSGVFPRPLTHEEEDKYLALAAEGDTEARNVLIEHNLRLVAHIVKKYYASNEEHDDLISIGTVGLIKAVCSFNGKKGVRLATYAARCIENEILMYFRSVRKRAGEVSLSDDTMLDDIEYDESRARLYKYLFSHLEPREREIVIARYGLYGREPMTQREIAAAHGISRSYVSRIEKRALEKLRAEFGDE